MYAFGFLVSGAIHYYVFDYNKWENIVLSVFATTLIGIVIIFSIICMSLFDGVRVHKIWKIVLSAICAIIAVLWTIYLQIILFNDGGLFLKIGDNFGFSITAIEISTTRVLAIFLWKQAYNTYRNAPKHKCVSLKYTPYITWTIHDNHHK